MSVAPERWVEAFAPAKVNLRLEVLGRRADGFHELCTWMLALDLGDRLRVRRTRAGRPHLVLVGDGADPDVPADERNLAWSAAQECLLVARSLGAAGEADGVAVELEKRIPSRSGLGGASSDAAAALVACSRLWDLDLSQDWAARLLARLGSDCAFFHEATGTGIAACEGRGERVRPLTRGVPPWYIGLVVPEVSCSTAEVYRALTFPLRPLPGAPSLLSTTTAAEMRPGLANHLEEAARRIAPELSVWRALLDGVEAEHYRLSGSGSSWFGLFDSREEAGESVSAIAAEATRVGLGVRLARVARPAGHGARVMLL